ncbi:MAG: hypothetical protein AAGC93_28135 [Cyanobacteria bacterium P01_F01_bin.53]
MKRIILTGLSTFSLLTLLTAPRALAQQVSTSITPEHTSAALTTSPISNIARNDRLTVTNPQAFSVSFRSSNSYTIHLELSDPVVNWGGEVLIPSGAIVEATLTLTEAGAQIVAHHIIYRSMSIELNTQSHSLPVQERIIRSIDEKFGDTLPYAQLIGNGMGTFIADDPDAGELVGVVISALVTNLFVEPDIEHGTYVGQQDFYLTLSDPIVVPFNKLAVIREEIEKNNVREHDVREPQEVSHVSASAEDLQ